MFSFSNVSFGRRRTCPDLVLNLKDASGPVKNSTKKIGGPLTLYGDKMYKISTPRRSWGEMHLKIEERSPWDGLGWGYQRYTSYIYLYMPADSSGAKESLESLKGRLQANDPSLDGATPSRKPQEEEPNWNAIN